MNTQNPLNFLLFFFTLTALITCSDVKQEISDTEKSVVKQELNDKKYLFESQKNLISKVVNRNHYNRDLTGFFLPTNKTILSIKTHSNIHKKLDDLLCKLPVGDLMYGDGLLIQDLKSTDTLFIWEPAYGTVIIKRIDQKTWEIKGLLALGWYNQYYECIGIHKRITKKEHTYYSELLPLDFSIDSIECDTFSAEYKKLKKTYLNTVKTGNTSFNSDLISALENLEVLLLSCASNIQKSNLVRIISNIENDFPECIGIGHDNICTVISRNYLE